MGMGLIYGLIILLIFSIIAIGLFFYSRKRKSKIGLTVSVIMILVVVFALLTNTIDELSISKKDIVSDLNHIDIKLKDDFKITDNTVTGMPQRIQKTEIQISREDKDRIMNEIRNSENFKSYANENEVSSDPEPVQFSISDKIFNFKYPGFYSREIYTKIENIPTILSVSIYANSDTIEYQRIEN